MIRVECTPEPHDFDERIRQPGLRAVAELAGEANLPVRPGRPRQPVAQTRDAIPADKFPSYWTLAIDDMMTAYGRICAYMSFYIEPVTGAGSVDHMLPKSVEWRTVYEWSNYRLACSKMNSRKNAYQDVLDPFEVEDDWFQLELTGYQVVAAPGLSPEVTQRVASTIDRLRLNDHDCLMLREAYAADYLVGHISRDYLGRRAPFLARELERQGQSPTIA